MNRFFYAALSVALLTNFASCASSPPPTASASISAPLVVPPPLPAEEPPAPEPARWRIPGDFRVVGYFPSWSGELEPLRYEALTHINYAFALVDATGSYRRLDEISQLEQLVQRAHASGVKVLISVGGWNEGRTKPFDRIAASPTRTKKFVDSSLAFVSVFGLDGLDLDWEYPRASNAANYAKLVQALVAAFRPRGLLVSLAVSANDINGRYVNTGAWAAADWLNVMAYDDGWEGKPGVPHSSYSFARASLDYWLGVRGLPRSKVILGVPFYGRSLQTRKARSYSSLVGEFPEAAEGNEAGGFAYNGPDLLRSKVVNLARLRAGGVMIWQLNQDLEGPGSLLSVIYDAVKEPLE